MKQKAYYTIKEFAEYIGVHYNTIYNGIKKGHIEAFRIGKGSNCHYRIAHTEIVRMGLFHLDEIIDKLLDKKLDERENNNKEEI